MAKIFFVGLDGAEKSYRLQTHRPFTLGRDPGNDIILRDPKVSRHHAEVVFERGFFVLHDLASANGTYVNGKRIRVAPLTHGARLRMGNTYGRFSEELPTESEAAPLTPGAGEVFPDPFEQAVPPTEDLGALDLMPTSQIDRVSDLHTLPHDKLDPAELKKKKRSRRVVWSGAVDAGGTAAAVRAADRAVLIARRAERARAGTAAARTATASDLTLPVF